jgi:hypothetical protein
MSEGTIRLSFDQGSPFGSMRRNASKDCSGV